MTDAELAEFVRTFQVLVRRALETAPEGVRSDLVVRLEEHLGVDPVGLPVVTDWHQPFEQANLHLALSAYVSSGGRSNELVGIGGQGREHHALSEILSAAAQHGAFPLGAVDYAAVAVGPGVERTVVNFGLYLVADGDHRLAVLLRGSSERHGRPMAGLEVLAADPAAAERLLAAVRALAVEHNIFRGQVVSFEPYEFGHGAGPVRFHERPALSEADIVLPPGALEAVTRQVVGIARYRDILRAAGHPLKRGVLLFGPPGAGKTHTVRFLLAQLPDFTAVLLSGMGLQYI
jgi:cell division protease FtsH